VGDLGDIWWVIFGVNFKSQFKNPFIKIKNALIPERI
jgi:hypothetical protein